MRKLFLLLILILLPSLVGATDGVSTIPTIYFSDLTSAPATGGKNNQGAFISLYGKNFGATRETSTITVNGTEASNYEVWLDTYAAFQMGSGTTTGNIILTTSAGASNTLPFTVRAGNIYFVDASTPTAGDGSYGNHWQSPVSYFNAMAAGDTCYFRAGTYSEKYHAGSSKYQISLTRAIAGTENNEIAWIGYPGEIARFEATAEGTIEGNIDFYTTTRDYYTFANLQLYGYYRACVYLTGQYNRIIGNDCESLKVHSYAIINPVTGCNYAYIYGNKLHGATSGNKLDHPLYIGYGADNVDFGWNYIYGNDVGYGPLISINQDYASRDNVVFENIRIHDNIIDCNSLARAIGMLAANTGSSFYIYNNIIYNGVTESVNQYKVLYQISGSAYVYNNVIYNPLGDFYTIGVSTFTSTTENYIPEIAYYKNNIIYGSTDVDYLLVEHEDVMGTVSFDYNCWYGSGTALSRDTHGVFTDPGFTSPGSENFVLLSTSTCRDVGLSTTEITDVAPKDFVGVSRPQEDVIDIGTYEYYTGATGSITNKLIYQGIFYGGSF